MLQPSKQKSSPEPGLTSNQLPAGWELGDPWAGEMKFAAPKGSSAPTGDTRATASQRGKHLGIFHDGKIPIKNGL